MFDENNLKCLNPSYFQIININEYDMTVMSRNTGHYWYLHNLEYPEESTMIFFHKFKANHPYHHHRKVNTIRQAVRSIHKHNIFQLNGKKSD